MSWATEYPLHEPLRLVVYLQNHPPSVDAQKVIERAVHNYFAYKTALNQRECKLPLREGRLSLVIGLLFLTLCLSGGQLANRFQIPGASIFETSLAIAGWWRCGTRWMFSFTDGGRCVGRARFIASSAPYLSKSDTPNLLAAPASLLHSWGFEPALRYSRSEDSYRIKAINRLRLGTSSFRKIE